MPKFEDSLKQLETIVNQLEKGDLPLEDSIKLFEERRIQIHCLVRRTIEWSDG